MKEKTDTEEKEEIYPSSDPLAEIRSSLGLVVNYSKGVESMGQTPPHDYEILKDIYFNDSIISTAVDLKAELLLSNGFRFRGKNVRDIEKAEKMFKDLNMYEVLLNFFKQAEVYGCAYLEPRYKNDKINEVWPLETPLTRMSFDEHGVLTGYLQVNNATSGSAVSTLPRWEPNELLYYKENWFGSNIYSYAPNVSIASVLSSRTLGNHYIAQIFRNLPPKMVHILKSANSKQLQQYKQTLQGVKSNTNQDLVVRTSKDTDGVEIKQFVVDFTKGGLMEVLVYLREEILVRMRMPPAMLGLQEGGGRSEPQVFILENHLRTKQKRASNFINKELMPLLGLSNVEFYFPPVFLGNEEVIMRIARSIIDSGISGEGENHPALVFLKEKGFTMPVGTKIEDSKEKDIESMPSRTRKGRKQGKEEGSNRDSSGDSPEGKEKFTDRHI